MFHRPIDLQLQSYHYYYKLTRKISKKEIRAGLLFYLLDVTIVNRSFLFVTFVYGVEYEAVGTADAYALILEHLPFVDFPEEPAEVVVVTIRVNHCIDKHEFTTIEKSRIIAVIINAPLRQESAIAFTLLAASPS